MGKSSNIKFGLFPPKTVVNIFTSPDKIKFISRLFESKRGSKTQSFTKYLFVALVFPNNLFLTEFFVYKIHCLIKIRILF
jgi:hypothetical protein